MDPMKAFAIELLGCGFSPKIIAARTGLPLEEVLHLQRVKKEVVRKDAAGQYLLFEHMAELAYAFSLFGNKFGNLLAGFKGAVNDEDLAGAIVPGDVKATVENLRSRFVILPAYHPPPAPVETEVPQGPN